MTATMIRASGGDEDKLVEACLTRGPSSSKPAAASVLEFRSPLDRPPVPQHAEVRMRSQAREEGYQGQDRDAHRADGALDGAAALGQ